jgi:hypothetical protein
VARELGDQHLDRPRQAQPALVKGPPASISNAIGDWPEQTRCALAGLLCLSAAEPAFARMSISDVLSAGPRALQQRDVVINSFSEFLDPGLLEAPARGRYLPPLISAAVIGGIFEVINDAIINERLADLPHLQVRFNTTSAARASARRRS